MSVFRINKNSNYTVMSNNHFKEKNMSLKAMGLLSLMLSLPQDWDYSIAGLSKICNDGKDSIRSALKELEDFGYLKREQIKENGRFSHNVYTLCSTISPCPKISDTEITVYDKLGTNNNSINNNNIINNNSEQRNKEKNKKF